MPSVVPLNERKTYSRSRWVHGERSFPVLKGVGLGGCIGFGMEEFAQDFQVLNHAASLGRIFDFLHASFKTVPELFGEKPFRLDSVSGAELMNNLAMFLAEGAAFIEVMAGAHAAAPREKFEMAAADCGFKLRTSGEGNESLMKGKVRLGYAADVAFAIRLVHEVALAIEFEKFDVRKTALAGDANRQTFKRPPNFVAHFNVLQGVVSDKKAGIGNAFDKSIAGKTDKGIVNRGAPHVQGFAEFKLDKPLASADLAFADGITQFGIG